MYKKAIEDLLNKVKKYTIIGERHGDEFMIDFMTVLFDSGRFSNFYMEGFERGDYYNDVKQQSDKLLEFWGKEDVLNKRCCDIVEKALERGLNVYGLDRLEDSFVRTLKRRSISYRIYEWVKRRKIESYDRSSEWARLILETSGTEPSLILVGTAHVGYPMYCEDDIIPSKMISLGVSREEITKIISIESEIVETGLYILEELPSELNNLKEDKVADYVWVTKESLVHKKMIESFRKLEEIARDNRPSF